MNLELSKIYEWPRSSQSIVYVIVFAIVFYFGYRWDIASIQDALQASQQQETDLKQQYEASVSKAAAIKNDLDQSAALMDLISKWKSKLVVHSNLPELLNEILKTGANNNLYFSLFSPGDEVKTDNYTRVPIKVVAIGSYQQLSQFISQVVNMPWIVVVGDFVISRGTKTEGADAKSDSSNSDVLTAEMTLDVYYLSGTKK